MLKLEIGSLFEGKYRIEEELGSGGMGTVFRALQLDLGRFVAIKLLNNVALAQDDAERFKREFKLLAQLSHIHVVASYSQGLSLDGTPYAVFELIDGLNLQSLLSKEEKLPWRRAVRIALQIAEGLAEAHKHGIIHRDIKPSNIMICSKPEADFVKIIDFGLAKIETKSELESLTESGILLGSVHYMSPEQCRAEKDLDARSDIYALACLLFELIGGFKLFDAANPVAVIYMQGNESPSRNLSKLASLAPAEIVQLLTEMLEKEKEKRPLSMEEISARLKNTLERREADTGEVQAGFEIKQQKLKRIFPALLFAAASILLAISTYGFLKREKGRQISNKEPASHGHAKSVRLLRSFQKFYETINNPHLHLSQPEIQANIRAWYKRYGHDGDIAAYDRAQAFYQIVRIQSLDAKETDLDKYKRYIVALNPELVAERGVCISLMVEMAQSQLILGQRKMAVDTLKKAAGLFDGTEISSSDKTALLILSRALLVLEQRDCARSCLDKLARVSKQNEFFNLYGDYQLAGGHLSDACKSYQDGWQFLYARRAGETESDQLPIIYGYENLTSKKRVIGVPAGGSELLGFAGKLSLLDPALAASDLERGVQVCKQELAEGYKLDTDWRATAELARRLALKPLERQCYEQSISQTKVKLSAPNSAADSFKLQLELVEDYLKIQ